MFHHFYYVATLSALIPLLTIIAGESWTNSNNYYGIWGVTANAVFSLGSSLYIKFVSNFRSS